MKKILLTLLGALLALPAMSYDGETFPYTYEGQTLNYMINGQGVTVTNSNYVYGSVKIPSYVTRGSGYDWAVDYDSYPVTSIGDQAFYGCSDMTSVEIPNTVASIGDGAFFGCSGLTSIEIPNSVISIGYGSFTGCSGLTSVEIPSSVESLGTSFTDCPNLTAINVAPDNKYYASSDGVLYFHYDSMVVLLTYPQGKKQKEFVIPNTVTLIGRYAFYGCTELESLIFSNTVDISGEEIFKGCTGLTSITIGNSVTLNTWRAFSDCSSLTEIRIGSGNEAYTSDNDIVYSKDMSTIIFYPPGKDQLHFEIPESVTSIGDYAFEGCTGLTSVEIPNSVTSIGYSAFSGCTGLTSVTIGNSVTSIGYSAFSGCTGLTSVTIGNSVTSIGNSAFSGCSGLISVEIPNSVTSIGDNAFWGCRGLTSMTVYATNPPKVYYVVSDYSKVTLYVPKESVEAYKTASGWQKFTNIIGIRSSAFEGTINGIKYIFNPMTMTASVTYAEQNSLSNYEGMQSVIIPETIDYDGESYTVTAIGDEAFNNCWGLKAVSLPSTLQTVGKLAFGYCTSLRSVTIPENVTTIDNEAFTGCSALASVEIGSSVETIGDYAFFGCTGLATLHVPESVKTIGENAFMGIHWINEVHAKSVKPADAPASAFSANAYRNATLVVPDDAVETYRAHPTWSNFLAISPVSGTPTRIEVVDGAIVVKGSGEVSVYDMKGAQVYSGAAGRIELPAGIYLVATDSLTRKVKI